MIRTTATPPVDITDLFPGLRPYARTAVRLHPRPGKPNMRDSHFGGPLMWPSAEPWPTCGQTIAVPDLNWQGRIPESPIPMVGVAQFYGRDIPEIPFPKDADLLQVLWCPNEHLLDNAYAPFSKLIWRRTRDLTDVVAEPPMRHYTTPSSPPEAPASELSQENYLPRPCVLHPERVTEYPYSQELPDQLKNDLNEWADDVDPYIYEDSLSIAPGCKIGGWESWHLTDMYELPCEVCGTETELVLKLDSSEWDSSSEPRWRPLEERRLEFATPEGRDAREPTTLILGRFGCLNLFLCPRSPTHGHRLTIQ